MPHLLTKSRYTAFRQCPKCLWMNVYEPEKAAEEAIPESRLKAGIEIGNLAKTYFGTYHEATVIRKDGGLDMQAMVERTKQLMADPAVQTICEAAFMTDDYYCAVDLLHREGEGWAIYEVKSSTGNDVEEQKPRKPIKEVQVWDISFQRYVLTLCGVKVTGTYLMRLDTDYVLDGELDVKQLFHVYNAHKEIEEEMLKVALLCAKAKQVLARTTELEEDLNAGCQKPHKCAFKPYCMAQHGVPTPSVFDLYRIQWRSALKRYYSGVVSYEQLLDSDFFGPKNTSKLQDLHLMQIQSTLQNEDKIDKAKIREFLDTLRYPIYQLDFESIQPAIPVYQGTHPYQQIPTQYSLHIQPSPFGECEHKEFLADGKSKNPMREVAEQLCRDIPMDGMVMVFNDTFEKGRIKEMAEAFPDLREHLLAIRENVVDLLDPFQAGAYYRPDMNGRFSIKVVLPSLFPDDPNLDYHNLPGCVHNGGEAMEIFPKLAEMEGEKLAQVRNDLLRYCELDTWSMVVILRKLYEVSV